MRGVAFRPWPPDRQIGLLLDHQRRALEIGTKQQSSSAWFTSLTFFMALVTRNELVRLPFAQGGGERERERDFFSFVFSCGVRECVPLAVSTMLTPTDAPIRERSVSPQILSSSLALLPWCLRSIAGFSTSAFHDRCTAL